MTYCLLTVYFHVKNSTFCTASLTRIRFGSPDPDSHCGKTPDPDPQHVLFKNIFFALNFFLTLFFFSQISFYFYFSLSRQSLGGVVDNKITSDISLLTLLYDFIINIWCTGVGGRGEMRDRDFISLLTLFPPCHRSHWSIGLYSSAFAVL